MKERNTSEENIKRMERRNCFSFAYLVLFAVEKKRNEMGNRGAECVFK